MQNNSRYPEVLAMQREQIADTTKKLDKAKREYESTRRAYKAMRKNK